MYVSEQTAGRIKKLHANGVMSTYASGLSNPLYLALDQTGNLYVAEGAGNVKKILTNGTIITYTGFNYPYGIDVDLNENLYVGEV